MTSPRVWIALTAVLTLACAGSSVSNLDQYQSIDLNKVYPYPSEADRANIRSEVALGRQYADAIPAEQADPILAPVDARLSEFLRAAGAEIVEAAAPISQSAESVDLDAASDPAPEPESEPALAPDPDSWADAPGDSSPAVADAQILSRITVRDYSAEWKKPTNWLFRSEEEMAAKPSTCKHRAEVVLEVVAYALPARSPALGSFRLTHSGDAETETLDQTCPYTEDQQLTLFAQVLDEALECLRVPLQNVFAPRGRVVAHRRNPEEDRDLFRTTLGSEYGATKSQKVSVLREQLSTASDGTRRRRDRAIATGTVTNRIGPDYAWVAVDSSDRQEPLLDGDVVRPVFEESIGSDLNPFGGCSSIVTELAPSP